MARLTKFDMASQMHREGDYYKTLVYYLFYDSFTYQEIKDAYNKFLNGELN